jgi:hypothetical protein
VDAELPPVQGRSFPPALRAAYAADRDGKRGLCQGDRAQHLLSDHEHVELGIAAEFLASELKKPW